MAVVRAWSRRRFSMSSVISVSSGSEIDTSVRMLRSERPDRPTYRPVMILGATLGLRCSLSMTRMMRVEVSSRFWMKPYLTLSTPRSWSTAITSSRPSAYMRPTAAIILELLISIAATYLSSFISLCQPAFRGPLLLLTLLGVVLLAAESGTSAAAPPAGALAGAGVVSPASGRVASSRS